MGAAQQSVAASNPHVSKLVLQRVSAGGLRKDNWTLQPGTASGLRRGPLQLVSAGGLREDPSLPLEPSQTWLAQRLPFLAGVQGSGGQDGVVGQLVHHPVLLECLCRIHSL